MKLFVFLFSLSCFCLLVSCEPEDKKTEGQQGASVNTPVENLPIKPENEIEALRLKAESGDSDSQYNLGVCYAKGRGVPKDDVEAVKLFRLAAEQGLAKAQGRLGLCYAIGDGIPKDQVEAVKWYRLAADQGYAKAQYILGMCHDTGEGVPKNIVEAVIPFN